VEVDVAAAAREQGVQVLNTGWINAWALVEEVDDVDGGDAAWVAAELSAVAFSGTSTSCVMETDLLIPGISTTGARASCNLRNRTSKSCLLICARAVGSIALQPSMHIRRSDAARLNVANPIEAETTMKVVWWWWW